MLRFAANISMLFAERDWLDRPAAAAAAGFEAIEIQFPYDRPAEDWRRAIEAAGLAVSVLNLPVGDMLTGGPGLAATPGREAEFRRAVETARGVAAALRPGNVNVLAGYPERHGFERARCLETLAENLLVAADAMGGIGIGVVVEAVNAVDRPGFLLTTSAEALEAVDMAGHGNLALQHDFYHMDIMEGRPIERLGEIVGRIGHVQFADNPGRREPGTGAIDFPAVFAALDRLGYEGWTAAEYRPSRRTEETLGWMTAAG
ncbi:MAG: TIM barrel protein [Defluviicoccus sp.]|nr:TIM barrel protein [Defluviicoccus sp.]MDE0384623.1 TIM barrel protein [Defluviicoccus sp.]